MGRFAQMDPVEGGTPNPYVYPTDPVNSSDYSGTFGLSTITGAIKKAATAVKTFVQQHPVVTTIIVAIVVIAVVVVVKNPVLAQTVGQIARAGITELIGVGAAAGGGKAVKGLTPAAQAETRLAQAGERVESAISPGYKSSLQTGQAAHNEFNAIVKNAGGKANSRLGDSTLRPDGQFSNGDVWELKPGNPRGLNAGLKQLQKYTDISGGKGTLWLYNQNSNGSFNFWQYQP